MLCVNNMRLLIVQQRILNGDLSIDSGDAPSMKRASHLEEMQSVG